MFTSPDLGHRGQEHFIVVPQTEEFGVAGRYMVKGCHSVLA
jgi:hypothetical protein